jgi:ubiquinone biosynthesis protein COQ9
MALDCSYAFGMDEAAFDRALITAAFDMAASDGWPSVTVGAAARRADLPLEQARARFPGRDAILLRFGRIADQAALTDAATDGSTRERLFDILMRRFDALQAHREGVRALLRALPSDPPTALLLALATHGSMGWMLEGAGVSSAGLRGALRAKGLTAVWLFALRAWDNDVSPDLAATMAALDRALAQAERVAGWVEREAPPAPKPFPEDPVGASDTEAP